MKALPFNLRAITIDSSSSQLVTRKQFESSICRKDVQYSSISNCRNTSSHSIQFPYWEIFTFSQSHASHWTLKNMKNTKNLHRYVMQCLWGQLHKCCYAMRSASTGTCFSFLSSSYQFDNCLFFLLPFIVRGAGLSSSICKRNPLFHHVINVIICHLGKPVKVSLRRLLFFL